MYLYLYLVGSNSLLLHMLRCRIPDSVLNTLNQQQDHGKGYLHMHGNVCVHEMSVIFYTT